MKHTGTDNDVVSYFSQRCNSSDSNSSDSNCPAPICNATLTTKYDTEPFILSKHSASIYSEIAKTNNKLQQHLCATIQKGEFLEHTYTNKSRNF